MNLIEALRTGKNLRRPVLKHTGATRTGYLGNSFMVNLLTGEPATRNFMVDISNPLITQTDLLADDWEVQAE